MQTDELERMQVQRISAEIPQHDVHLGIVSFYVNRQHGTVALPLPPYLAATVIDTKGAEAEISKRFKKFSVSGTEHRLFLAQDARLDRATVGLKGRGNTLIVGAGTNIRGTIAIQGEGLTVSIGAGTTFNNVEIYCKGKRNGVYIGRDCMFSSGIEIRTSDAHTLIDLDTMTPSNHPDGVYIGDHVWVSKNVFIQKGTKIGDDNVIGFGSMAKGNLDVTNSVIVGTPAKKIPGRTVTWSRKGTLKEVDLGELNAWKSLPLL